MMSDADVFVMMEQFKRDNLWFEEAMKICADYERLTAPRVRTYTRGTRNGKPFCTWDDTGEDVKEEQQS